MQPRAGETCGTYLQSYATAAGGSIYNPEATADCQYCSASNADQFLSSVNIRYSTRWRDYGIVFAFIVFNIFMAVLFYYLIRVRKSSGRSFKEKLGGLAGLFKRDSKSDNTKTTKKKMEAPYAKGDQ